MPLWRRACTSWPMSRLPTCQGLSPGNKWAGESRDHKTWDNWNYTILSLLLLLAQSSCMLMELDFQPMLTVTTGLATRKDNTEHTAVPMLRTSITLRAWNIKTQMHIEIKTNHNDTHRSRWNMCWRCMPGMLWLLCIQNAISKRSSTTHPQYPSTVAQYELLSYILFAQKQRLHVCKESEYIGAMKSFRMIC